MSAGIRRAPRNVRFRRSTRADDNSETTAITPDPSRRPSRRGSPPGASVTICHARHANAASTATARVTNPACERPPRVVDTAAPGAARRRGARLAAKDRSDRTMSSVPARHIPPGRTVPPESNQRADHPRTTGAEIHQAQASSGTGDTPVTDAAITPAMASAAAAPERSSTSVARWATRCQGRNRRAQSGDRTPRIVRNRSARASISLRTDDPVSICSTANIDGCQRPCQPRDCAATVAADMPRSTGNVLNASTSTIEPNPSHGIAPRASSDGHHLSLRT